MTDERNNDPTTKPWLFQKGNPGRPKGSRHRVTRAVELLLDGAGEEITMAAIKAAKSGDLVAIRLVLDRVLPAKKDRPVSFPLPPINSASDAAAAMAAIVQAVAEGDLTPSEASEIAKVLESYTKTLELVEFEKRLQALEASR